MPAAGDTRSMMDAMNSQPRCPIRGCFIVYRGGDDRLCPIHQADPDNWQARMDEFGVAMATGPGDYTAATATGDSDGDHDTSTEGSPPRFTWKQTPS
jgi:hypothetical protein